MTDKKLEFKHAHITGQAMRDHWGPIVERIAAETADWRDEWIYDLITENERIKDRLGWICAVMDLDDDVSLQWVYTELEALRGLGETK